MTVRVRAPAKVNLSLRITGRRPDGYHLLDTHVVFTDLCDEVTVAPSDTIALTVSGPAADGVPCDDRNLVWRAAAVLRDARGVAAGAAIHLTKTIPNGAGLGGGSSDAAATLGALARLWNVPPLGADEALALGADLPVCLHAPHPARATGIGEVVAPWPDLPPRWIVLVNPGLRLDTGEVFRRFARDRAASPSGAPVAAQSDPGEAPPDWLGDAGNDLLPAAAALAPSIPSILDACRAQAGCECAGMSGSGSTCWALFASEVRAAAAAADMRRRFPSFWVRSARVFA